MTADELDALVRRANAAGFPTVPEYAVHLERLLYMKSPANVGMSDSSEHSEET